MAKAVIIIPAFNEERVIGRVITEASKARPGYSILVIDDASTDQTARIAEALPGVKVLTLSCNLGYGAALQAGYKYALGEGYDYLVQMDADGQHNPAGIEELLKPVLSDECDIAIGSRFLGRAEYNIGAMKLCGMKLFSFLTRLVTGEAITDPTSGFQAMNRRALLFYASEIYPSDFPDADVIIMSRRAGLRIKETPAVMRPGKAGRSMHQGLAALYYVFKMLLSILVILIRRKPRLEEESHAS